ncbi:60 kDa lysophospholipase-like [Scleropages formosus]|uniref:asparaginase n=1 Tax=Scleropages formosus TaxID=113540 RepID=A0A0N8JX89_SCLFO|nr:60 kDa lysophospholipase-like [Scleropages formosus]
MSSRCSSAVMAEGKRCCSVPSVSSEVPSLGTALSHTRLNQLEHSDVCLQSQVSAHRGGAAPSCRRRRLSSSASVESLTELSPSAEARVLVINTGGTIGMMYHNNGKARVSRPREFVLCPEPNALVKALRKLPILHDELYAQQTRLYDYYGPQENTLVLPSALYPDAAVLKRMYLCVWCPLPPYPQTSRLSRQKKRIVYTVLEYSPLLDSCNMTTDDWASIAKDLEKHYEKYDGFVILHGTDTMAYTASALSFMCENLGKPVILTGSQVPIYEMRNDGRDNLLGALLIAGQFVIPEVCLYFHHKLYRGNRVTKVDSGSFNAFTSPNLPPLANAEVDIKINWDTVWRANTTAKFLVHTHMNRNVGLLRLFPGITADTVRAFLQPPMEGIVLETYGSGNAPNNRIDLLEEFHKATGRGVIIVNCTQCLRGSVTTSYATGKALIDVGLVPGCDMTPEAALSKLSYILAKQDLSMQEKRKVEPKPSPHSVCQQWLVTNTPAQHSATGSRVHGGPQSAGDVRFMRSSQALSDLSANYTKLLFCAQMMSRNLRGEMIANLEGAQLSLRDSRFIQVIAKSLSISCKEELEAIRDALTPTLACAASKIGDVEALEAIREMGSNLSMEDYDGRTPLHIASCEGHLKVVQYLLSHGATVYAKDRYGDTPLRNAVRFRWGP